MRAIYSYGTAGVITLVAAVWLGTGTLVVGGNGPGNGETAIVSLVEKDGGPLTETFKNVGLEPHTNHYEIDPHLTIAQRVAEATGASAPKQSVRTETFSMQAFSIEVPLRGRTKAKSTVTVTPQTSGVVTAVTVAKGDQVTPGQVLCTLEEGSRGLAVTQAEAALAQAQLQFDTNAELRQKGLAAANTATSFEVQLKSAQATLDQAQRELERTQVKTEVAGVVQDPIASVGSMLAAGTPCATVVELDPMLFVGTVPESRMALAKIGLKAKVTTVTGQSAEGEVSYLASMADEATRSFPVEIALPNPDGELLSGSTATAVVNLGTVPAHLLPQSVLTLDDTGEVGIRAVEDSKVTFYPVTILSDSRDGIWVTGLPASVDVITVGQEFVQAGQMVDATNVTAGASGTETTDEGVAS
jgi:membrane fusion protein, multidrug efflux system